MERETIRVLNAPRLALITDELMNIAQRLDTRSFKVILKVSDV